MAGDSSRSSRLSTVMAARYYASNPDVEQSLPRLPRAIFFSLVLLAFEGIKSRCPDFAARIPFMIALVTASASAGLWLIAALSLRRAGDEQRKAHIEQFIGSVPGNEPIHPPHLEVSPRWLRTWEALNMLAYLSIVAVILISFFQMQ